MKNQQQLTLPVRNGGGRTDFERGSILFVGTATVILRYAGFTILTDPNFLHSGDHVHLCYGLTSRRLTDPALDIEELLPLDLCLLSHLHGDHFDRIAERKLDKHLPIITTRHAAASLKRKGFKATRGLGTWDTITIRKGGATLRLTSMPGTHAPGPLALLLPPVMGSLLEFETAEGKRTLRLYISGDTLIHEDLKEIPRRFPDIDIALLHLGGTRVLGLLVTMDAEQGVEAIKMIRPHTTIPIHYNDYTVFKSPLRDFQKAARAAGLERKIVYLSHGESYGFNVPASRWQGAQSQAMEETMSTRTTTGEEHGATHTAPAMVGSSAATLRDGNVSGTVSRQYWPKSSTRGNGRHDTPAQTTGAQGLNTGLLLIGGIGLGAALMYLFDPEKGRWRRALVRDKVIGATNQASQLLGQTSRDLQNRTHGIVAEAGSALGDSATDDERETGRKAARMTRAASSLSS